MGSNPLQGIGNAVGGAVKSVGNVVNDVGRSINTGIGDFSNMVGQNVGQAANTYMGFMTAPLQAVNGFMQGYGGQQGQGQGQGGYSGQNPWSMPQMPQMGYGGYGQGGGYGGYGQQPAYNSTGMTRIGDFGFPTPGYGSPGFGSPASSYGANGGSIMGTQNSSYNSRSPMVADSGSRGFNPWSLQGESNVR